MPVVLATPAMGTRFELVLDAGFLPERHVYAAGEAALEEIRQVEARWSAFRSDSLLAHLQREAWHRACLIEPDDFVLLQMALGVWRASAGAFDPTRRDHDRADLGPEAIALDARHGSVSFKTRELRLDLGGIAKGWALDRAASVLRQEGIHNALLHGGSSSVLALGAPPGQAAWQVALDTGANAPVIALRDCALGVSSQDVQLASHGRMHVVDPVRGTPAASELCAVVIGPCAAIADAWSTALLVQASRPEWDLDSSTRSVFAGREWLIGRGRAGRRDWSRSGSEHHAPIHDLEPTLPLYALS